MATLLGIMELDRPPITWETQFSNPQLTEQFQAVLGREGGLEPTISKFHSNR